MIQLLAVFSARPISPADSICSPLIFVLGLKESRMSRFFLILVAHFCLFTYASMVYALSPFVTANISSSTIVITNRTSQSICYAVHESELLTRIEWGPECSSDNLIGPKTSIRVSFQPGDFEPSGEAVVSWWFENKNVVEGHLKLNAHNHAQQSGAADAKSGRR